MSDLDVIRQAIEERDAALAEVRALSESMEYRGNSISWWHTKATRYGDELLKAWAELTAAGVPCDGQTTVAEGIRKLAATKRLPASAPAQQERE
jgi:hypothetical protein